MGLSGICRILGLATHGVSILPNAFVPRLSVDGTCPIGQPTIGNPVTVVPLASFVVLHAGIFDVLASLNC
jgi:hypothetical protein